MSYWQTKKLDEMCEYISRGVSPKYISSGGIAVLNQKCIRDHKVNFNESRRHDISNKNVAIEKILRPGDVLVNSTGVGTLGRVAQLKTVPQKSTVDSHITIVRPKSESFDSDFFGYVNDLCGRFFKKNG